MNKNAEEVLLKLGYSKEDAENILNNESLVSFKGDTLVVRIKINFECLIALGYSKEDVLKMTKQFPSLYGLSIENIKKKIGDLMSLGYSKEDVLKMTKLLPSLYNLSIENIKKKIEDLILLGYTKEDVLKMTRLLPSLYSISIENIKQKIENLISLGYSKEDALKMTKLLPTLYGLSIENIKKKIIFYKQNNLDFIVVDDTKNLMQSIDLTYARFMFFKEKNIEISQDNYSRLFYNAKQFEKQYGIDKSTLLEKYNYQEYINSKSIRNVI